MTSYFSLGLIQMVILVFPGYFSLRLMAFAGNNQRRGSFVETHIKPYISIKFHEVNHKQYKQYETATYARGPSIRECSGMNNATPEKLW